MTEPTVESLQKELTELRTNVIDVARRYAEEHGLCSVIDEALNEVPGLLEPEEIELEIKVPFTLKAQVDRTRMNGTDLDAEVAKALANHLEVTIIDPEEALASVPFLGRPTISPEAFRDSSDIGISLKEIEVNGRAFDGLEPNRTGNPRNPWNAPRGYVARLGSYEGRVMHYFPDRDDQWLQALCGGAGGYKHNLPETGGYFQNKVCVRCTRRAEGMTR